MEHFPAIAILGPRQTGKTTLVKEIRKRINKESIYLDLENPSDLSALDHPVEFLNSLERKVVIMMRFKESLYTLKKLFCCS
jgi:predicted AAA+ superfamily ATPase